MTNYEIGQSKVVSTSGPGSLTILQEGMSVMMPGLDSWYRLDSPVEAGQEFIARKQEIPEDAKIVDQKLGQFLGVDFFVRPPMQGHNPKHPHTEYLDVLLFPTWMVCYSCRKLSKETAQGQFLPHCHECKEKSNRRRNLTQVNFLVACPDGHIDEFPWFQWVHKSATYVCAKPNLKLETKGAGELASQKITCTGCQKSRNLAGTNESYGDQTLDSDKDKTVLGIKLTEDASVFYCSGKRPWMGDQEECFRHPKMVLRAATNAYYSFATKSIFLPTEVQAGSEVDKLVKEHERKLRVLKFQTDSTDDLVNTIIYSNNLKHLGLSKFPKEELLDSIERMLPDDKQGSEDSPELEGNELALFSPEFEALRKVQESKDLVVREVTLGLGSFPGIARVNAVHKLTITKAFSGFSRLIPKTPKPSEAKSQLHKKPFLPKSRWLPAVQGVGEGIFIEFDEHFLSSWEVKEAVRERSDRIMNNFLRSPHYDATLVSARKVLIHTLSHLLIQQLTNDSGYTATSLGEKIYASQGMAGLLIYTASEDADGTMGGLVQLAKADYLETIFARAFDSASWCSNDPICTELGNSSGQGDYGTNLSACYLCSMLPETTCEHFNQFLDRGLVIPIESHSQEKSSAFFENI